MNPTAAAVLAVGGAVLAPSLLHEARAAGVRIPAFVTAAHVVATAKLSAPILGVGPLGGDPHQANHRFLEVRRALVLTRGAIGPAKNYANLSAADAMELLARFIAACTAGAKADDDSYYRLVNTIGGIVNLSDDVADTIAAGDDAPGSLVLTDLGRALKTAGATKARIASGWLGFDERDAIDAQNAVAHLAIEMDAVGYLESGEPFSYGLGDGLAAAGEFWKDKGKRAGAWVADKLSDLGAGAVGALVFSTPGLLAIGGLLVWRMSR